MIHYKREGEYLKLGLNFRITDGGILFIWAWYNIAKHEMTTHRFRLRLHRNPMFMYACNRWDVVDNYLRLNGLEAVNVEVLQDLKVIEETQKKRNERFAYIKPT